MKKFVGPDRKHHFFKVLLEEDETRMRIPEAFYPRISTESQSCERAVVQGPSGAQWVTKVKKNRDGVFFEKGWEVFVRENGLQIYDFLVFRYDGRMQFSVKVFNMYGVPREECFTSFRSSPLVEERIRHGRSSGCPPVGRLRTSLSRERCFVGQQRRRRRQDRDESDEDSDEDEVPKKTSTLSSSRKKRRQSIACEEYVARADEIEHEFASRSNSPFFRVILQPAYLRCNYLPIPLAAKRAYVPDDVEKVKVKHSDGRSWKIRILRSKTDTRLSKGVSDFLKRKNGLGLKVGDVCIFEVMKKISHQLVVRVHVFPLAPVQDEDSDEDEDLDNGSDEDLEDDSDE